MPKKIAPKNELKFMDKVIVAVERIEFTIGCSTLRVIDASDNDVLTIQVIVDTKDANNAFKIVESDPNRMGNSVQRLVVYEPIVITDPELYTVLSHEKQQDKILSAKKGTKKKTK